MTYDSNTRDIIYKYRENNKEKWDEQNRKNAKAYYEKHKEVKKIYMREQYHRRRKAQLDAILEDVADIVELLKH